MPNNSFEFSRFLRFLRLSWATQPLTPYYLMLLWFGVGKLSLLSVAREGSISIFDDYWVVGMAIVVMSCGWLYAGLSFSEFSDKDSARRFLLLPASTFEKWLSRFLLSFFVFPAICIACTVLAYWFISFASVQIFAYRQAPISWTGKQAPQILHFFYLLLPGAFVSGLMWKRFGIFKSAILASILIFLLIQITIWISAPGGVDSLIRSITVPGLEKYGNPDFVLLNRIFWAFAFYVPSLLLLVASYFFIKEKEI